jgi:hypothetical protein
VNGRHLLYNVAARIFPGRRRAERTERRAAEANRARDEEQARLAALRDEEQARLAARREEEYASLIARVKGDLALDERFEHVEDLIAHLERRIDRILRELARKDPATQWEPQARQGEGREP